MVKALLLEISNTMTIKSSVILSVIENLLRTDAWRTTKFVSDKVIVRATRKTFNGKLSKQGNLELIVSIGKPNYKEREYIKLLKKAKEPFPVKKMLTQFPPQKRKK